MPREQGSPWDRGLEDPRVNYLKEKICPVQCTTLTKRPLDEGGRVYSVVARSRNWTGHIRIKYRESQLESGL